MTHEQYVRHCQSLEMPEEDYDGVPYPHPYLLIWIECRRYSDPMTGRLALYDSTQGPEGQDAHLTLALDILEEAHAAYQQEEQAREQARERAREQLSYQHG